jgi:hypothetical protein
MSDLEPGWSEQLRKSPDDKPTREPIEQDKQDRTEPLPRSTGRASSVSSQPSPKAVTLGRTGWTGRTSESGPIRDPLAVQRRLAAAQVPSLRRRR